ncbi:gamma carbonic anhydrase family protein [Thiohalophilus thiocyanatoxydans]|uniref:Carbonic anhydrase/acetyltransferase-like protein (Isoleucine patch superfamily) n=1 Tax=Thiohalophilus thiocyanatoxydans TaxID=381308 RepID=A0A4R8ITZ1_9GAMM|nr:gamma carbonic anhydrase family protein [Thiohalophilus thiocyanatoxydans]TDY03894.1 carbonic anhydrase/acetyltransferase-like protein (isoleucine patch superfamily) [Thiohalophilus thiocyanatoxydans]
MAIRDFEEVMPDLHPDVYVDESALVIGDVVIGKDSSVWPFAVIRGDVNIIRIGASTNIQDNSVLHVTHDGPHNPGGYALNVGDNVTVGHRVILHGCSIADNCLIGMGATIMDGAVIPEHTIIGAGSLVTPGKELESGLWLGSPARRVRELSDEERDLIVYSARHYVRLKNRHQQS